MAATLQFVDHTPQKNAAFVPPETVGVPADPIVDGPELAGEGWIAKTRFHITKLRQYKDERLKTLRPWREFADRSQFSIPGKMEAFSRANKNVSYYYSNYVVLTAAISAYVLFTNFLFLTAMVLSSAVYYYVRMKADAGEPISIRGMELSAGQAYVALIASTLFLFVYTGGSSTIFWLVSLALLATLGHAITRQPPEDPDRFSFV